jgi:predicted N-acetyltransferase YhbS
MGKPMDNKWTIREATIDDSRAIAQLHSEVYQEVYHIDRHPESIWAGDTPSWWKWWNLDNPTKQSYSFVAEDAGRIVGHDAFRYTWLNVGGEKKLAAIGWGRMTHPAYMRQGITRSLRTTIQDLAARDGVITLLASCTELGRVSCLALVWHELGRMNVLKRVLNPRTLVMKKTSSPVLAAISGTPLDLALRLLTKRKRMRRDPRLGNIVEISFFDRRFDHLWAKLKDIYPISIWKDSEYLNWRYIARPDTKYQVLAVEGGEVVYGFVVLRCVDSKYRIGHIADLLVLPEKEAYASLLIDRAVDCLRESGADIAVCQMFRHNPCYQLLTGSGFLNRGSGGFSMIRKLADVGALDMLDVRNWFLTRGDSDGI